MTRRAPQLQRISRRGLISSAVLAGVLSATGVQVQARSRGGVLRLGLSGSADLWDPRRAGGTFARVAGPGAVYDTLTEISAAGELTGELAESWEPHDGARRWTVSLRREVPFHDGRIVTAGDVVASLAIHRDGSPAAPILAAIAGIRALGPHQVQFSLAAPDANFPLMLADPHLIVAPQGRFDGIGSGLYRVAEHLPGERLRLSRVEGHYRDGRAGWFDALVLRAMPDAAARTAALIGGHVDAVDFPATPERIAARRGLRLLETPDHGIAFTDPGAAAALGLVPRPGLPPGLPLHLPDAAYCPLGCGGALYGAGLETLVPGRAIGPQAIAGHLPFALAHGDRLRHDEAGTLGAMDSGRIAERWWFA